MYNLQSIIFNKHLWSINECISFLINHNLKHNKIDITDKYYRFRQKEPENLIENGFNKVITKQISRGVKFILYY